LTSVAPTWTTEQVLAVLPRREQYPRWGKEKLQVLLQHQRWRLSVAMVGRILGHLKRSGQLVHPAQRINARVSTVVRLAKLTVPSPTARRSLITRFRV
jgi:hypothetical protein